LSTVLITGAGGYIGGRLVPRLLAEGHEVTALVREPAPRLGVEQVVCELAAPESFDTALRACSGADTVVHLAGENEVLAGRRPAAALSATLVAAERIAEACARTGVERLVYLSTVHVYGARMTPGATLTEEMRVEPRSAYAISRLASEHVAAGFAEGSYELVVLRLTNSVGAPDHPSVSRWSLVANDLCRQGAVEGRLELRSSGTQWRDFVALGDVCSAIAVAGPARGLAPGIYNLASGQPLTVRGLAELIQHEFERATGRRPELHAPAPEADPPGPYLVSNQRAADHGVKLQSPLEQSVAETVRFCLDHREELK
jgi:UDP-glucose 4-epimerase